MMKWKYSIRSLLAVTVCLAGILSLQVCVERQAKDFERDLTELSESIQERLMSNSKTQTPNTYQYSVSGVNLNRQTNVLDYLCFKRRAGVTFESTNFVGGNQSTDYLGESISEGWTHNQEYVLLPFRNQLVSNESACDFAKK